MLKGKHNIRYLNDNTFSRKAHFAHIAFKSLKDRCLELR